MSEQVKIVEVKPLRKVLQRFNEDLGKYINDDRRFKLGRVLTIIDASISDTEQRKAIKDLVQNEWWSNSVRPTDSPMSDPHEDIRGLTLALGFELYEPSNDLPEVAKSAYAEWATDRYKKVALEEK